MHTQEMWPSNFPSVFCSREKFLLRSERKNSTSTDHSSPSLCWETAGFTNAGKKNVVGGCCNKVQTVISRFSEQYLQIFNFDSLIYCFFLSCASWKTWENEWTQSQFPPCCCCDVLVFHVLIFWCTIFFIEGCLRHTSVKFKYVESLLKESFKALKDLKFYSDWSTFLPLCIISELFMHWSEKTGKIMAIYVKL